MHKKEGGEGLMSECHVGGRLGFDAGKFEACMECDNFAWCASETQSHMRDIREKEKLVHVVNRHHGLPRKRTIQRITKTNVMKTK